MIFGAMFDEVDEGTAMFKTVANSANLPVEARYVALDADGCTLPSDWYLTLAGNVGRLLRGEVSALKPMEGLVP